MASQHSQPLHRNPRLRPVNRIAVNILLDGVLAALAAPLARWLAAPQDGLLHPLWFLAGGAITLLVSGLPFRMPQQYWRFSGVSDLLGIAGASIASSVLFSCGLVAVGFPLPSLTFPIIYALVLLVMLGGLRVGYRLAHRIALRRANLRRVVLIGQIRLQICICVRWSVTRKPGFVLSGLWPWAHIKQADASITCPFWGMWKISELF